MAEAPGARGGVPARLAALVDRLGERKRASASLVTAHARELRPGLWWVVGTGELRHARRPPAAPARRRTTRSGGPRPPVRERLAQSALRVLVPLVPPLLVRVPAASGEHGGRGGRGGRGGADRALVTKAGGVVLLDRRAGTVVHVGAPGTWSVGYERRRRELAAVLPVPAWSTGGDRSALRERLAPGRELSTCSPARRRAVLEDLAARCAGAAGGAGRGGSGDLVAAALAHLRAATGVPAAVRRRGEELSTALLDAAPRWPLVAAHGDLTGLNVLVERSGAWSVIDIEDARDLPFFFDVVSLVVRDDDLSRAAAAGDLDPLLGRLATAAGVEAPVAAQGPLWAVAVALLAASHHAERHGGDYAFTLGRLWPSWA